jgi:hypothetical protein
VLQPARTAFVPAVRTGWVLGVKVRAGQLSGWHGALTALYVAAGSRQGDLCCSDLACTEAVGVSHIAWGVVLQVDTFTAERYCPHHYASLQVVID